MLVLALKINAAYRSGTWHGWPTRSHLLRPRGTAKTRVNWAFVSLVSPVSSYLELIAKYGLGNWIQHQRLLIGPTPRALRQVGQAQRIRAFKVREPGRDTPETGGTVHAPSRFKGSNLKTMEK